MYSIHVYICILNIVIQYFISINIRYQYRYLLFKFKIQIILISLHPYSQCALMSAEKYQIILTVFIKNTAQKLKKNLTTQVYII